ncbi:MAG: hypothetical protein E6J88_01565 [Deltaproteobacteria bacterium]|nr:MAG: hypothetical protein E6J88_01565 [Deltaproteobacteria bacterium]
MTVLRGIGAIVLCFVVVSALSFGVDGILHATGVFPPWGQPMAGHLFTLALAYRIVFDTFGTWIVGVWISGAIGFAFSLFGIIATMQRGSQLGPLWYPIALTASVPLTTWVGGRLGIRRSPSPG